MKTFLDKLLEFYKIDEVTYQSYLKHVTVEDLPSRYNFAQIKEACAWLKEQVKANKKILIYGDYDCDGVMSTSIIFNMLKQDGFKPGFYIPFRETDGYGLNIKNIDRFHSLGYEVIVLVDNGITLTKEIDYLNSLGMKALIIDHHTPMEELPKAEYIIHWQTSGFGDINMSAGAISAYFSWEYLGYVDEYLFTLGMISLISDLMELKGYNKTFVKIGLEFLNKNKYYNIVKLLNSEGEITETDISMYVAPKVNAVGRIVNDNGLFNVVRLFINDDKREIDRLVTYVNNVNEERKTLVNEVHDTLDLKEFDDDPIVIKVLDIREGLASLVANKVLEITNKPTLILVQDHNHEDKYKGSFRSREGFNVVEVLHCCEDLLSAYGGHAFAGGMQVSFDNFEEFKQRLVEYAKSHPFAKKSFNEYVDINLNEITLQNYQILRTFYPFGNGNPLPLLRLKDFPCTSFRFTRDHKHVMTKVSFNSSLLIFNYEQEMLNNRSVNLYGRLEDSVFRGNHSAQFRVNHEDWNID